MKSVWAGLAFAAMGAMACVDDSGATQSPYPGTWTCQVTDSITVTGKSTVVTDPDTETLIVTQDGSSLSVDDHSSYGDCPATAVVSGNTATITGGTCAFNDTTDDVFLDITYTGGTLVVTATNAFSGNVSGAFTGTANGQNVTGTINGTYSCTK